MLVQFGITAPILMADEPGLLRSSLEPGAMTHIDVLLEVGGDLKLTEAGKIKSLKMSVVGKLAYDEKRLPTQTDSAGARAVRHYTAAEATIKVEKGMLKPHLRADRHLVAALEEKTQLELFSPQGPLTREELDLIDVPANSLLLDRLLPAEPVKVGDHWRHDDPLLTLLLGLDAISASDVHSELKEMDATAARMELSGNVQGAIGGVSTELELKGRYKFNRAQGTVTWVALLIEEKRSIGHVGPGADVVAKLQMTVTPTTGVPELADEALANLALEGKPEQAVLEYRSPGGRWSMQHDRRWHVMTDKADSMAMRLIERGDLLAQCNVSQLPQAEPGKQPSLARFQEDVQRALDKDFKRFLHASETRNSLGYSIYRVVAEGVVSDLAIEWVYYLVADSHGQQVVYAFTIEPALSGRLADADLAIVESLVFKDPIDTAAEPKIAR
ncbi:MAG TPA: hypothetical protein VIK18_26425 [Pirellulales bacterium]